MAKMRRLWEGRRHIFVVPPDIDPVAPEAMIVRCPKKQAYDVIDDLERACVRLKPDVVVITGGPMATCLANRVARHGIQGLDFGRAVGLLGLKW